MLPSIFALDFGDLRFRYNPVVFSFMINAKISKFQSGVKHRPNDRNMPTQHIAPLLGATCCERLATVLRHVATCWVLIAQIWKWSKLTQQHPTCRNTAQHGGQTHATCCAQQCYNMLDWHVAIVWPGLYRQNVFLHFPRNDIGNVMQPRQR